MNAKENHNKTVFVAMSGGVDSSVATSLLCKEGYFVVGVYMKCWSDDSFKGASCWEEDIEDARRVASKLNIPFKVVDFEAQYRQKVMDYFFSEYKKGRTPNPDVECNREIKFGLFLEKAREMGADFVATGHHVRSQIDADKEGFISCIEADKRGLDLSNNEIRLLKGADEDKDQSYFLWPLGQDELKYCLFPIGDYKKEKVREIADDLKLPVHDKPDSTGICFVGEVDIQEFLKENIGTKPGPVVNHKGEKIGTHEGLWFYTLGQRQGIGIGGGIPYYVYDKDVKNNALKVVPKKLEREYLFKKELAASDLNWIADKPNLPLRCKAKIRYLQPDQDCEIERVRVDLNSSPSYQVTKKKLLGNKRRGGVRSDNSEPRDEVSQPIVRVKFDKPQRAITPGQSVVFYDGDIVLGGGIIQ